MVHAGVSYTWPRLEGELKRESCKTCCYQVKNNGGLDLIQAEVEGLGRMGEQMSTLGSDVKHERTLLFMPKAVDQAESRV